MVPTLFFIGFGDSSLDFELRAHVLDIDNWFITRTELILEIERKFREVGIQIPFPQRDLHLRSVDESVTSTSPGPGFKHLRLVPEEKGEDGKDEG